eukprot:gene8653-10270_t
MAPALRPNTAPSVAAALLPARTTTSPECDATIPPEPVVTVTSEPDHAALPSRPPSQPIPGGRSWNLPQPLGATGGDPAGNAREAQDDELVAEWVPPPKVPGGTNRLHVAPYDAPDWAGVGWYRGAGQRYRAIHRMECYGFPCVLQLATDGRDSAMAGTTLPSFAAAADLIDRVRSSTPESCSLFELITGDSWAYWDVDVKIREWDASSRRLERCHAEALDRAMEAICEFLGEEYGISRPHRGDFSVTQACTPAKSSFHVLLRRRLGSAEGRLEFQRRLSRWTSANPNRRLVGLDTAVYGRTQAFRAARCCKAPGRRNWLDPVADWGEGLSALTVSLLVTNVDPARKSLGPGTVHDKNNFLVWVGMTGTLRYVCQREEWLNDDVISLYLAVLQHRGLGLPGSRPRVHFFDALFHRHVVPTADGVVDCAIVRQRVATRGRGFDRGYEAARCKVFVMPVYFPNHWALAVLDLRSGIATYFDSMPCGAEIPECLGHLCAVVRQMLVESGAEVEAREWTRATCTDAPRQIGPWDCGVFVLMGAERIAEDLPLDYSQHDVPAARMRITRAILDLGTTLTGAPPPVERGQRASLTKTVRCLHPRWWT